MGQPDAAARERVFARIRELDLEKNVLELEEHGFTTIPGVLSADTIARATRAIVDRVERETGERIDVETETGDRLKGMSYLAYLLYDDPVFEEILVEPKPLALMTYLLGESCLLSSLGCHFKCPGEEGVLPLHSDNGNGAPAPYSAVSQVANINYALTPYSEEAGALALVPGSHRLARQPRPDEMMLGGPKGNRDALAMNLAPGDAVVWHGNTWHGSYARSLPGARVPSPCAPRRRRRRGPSSARPRTSPGAA